PGRPSLALCSLVYNDTRLRGDRDRGSPAVPREDSMTTFSMPAVRGLARRMAWLGLVALGMAAAAVHAGEASVAVAANFLKPMQAIAPDFTAATGHRLVVSGGSTGKLHAQIVAGAPFDVLLAADTKTPARLVEEGHGVAGSPFTYAIGQLVL